MIRRPTPSCTERVEYAVRYDDGRVGFSRFVRLGSARNFCGSTGGVAVVQRTVCRSHRVSYGEWTEVPE